MKHRSEDRGNHGMTPLRVPLHDRIRAWSLTLLKHCIPLLLLGASSEALAQGQNTAPSPPAAGAQKAFGEPVAAPWKWRVVLSHMRTGIGRMTYVKAHPSDPLRVYVGTEESTLFRTMDGGVTWEEIDMQPYFVQDRTLNLQSPDLPRLGETVNPLLTIFYDPPYSTFIDRLVIPGISPVQYSIFPDNMRVLFLINTGGLSQDLLANAARVRRRETYPVNFIEICPGARYELLVSTRREVYASDDDGMTWVRLWALPGRTQRPRSRTDSDQPSLGDILQIACSPTNPNEILIGTEFGLYRSVDGGLSVDYMPVGWPGQPAQAVGFAPHEPGKPAPVLVAFNELLFMGDPENPREWDLLYPDFKNTETIPWLRIIWIKVTKSGQIWLGTDDGFRVSRDGGKTWVNQTRERFDYTKIRGLEIGANEKGEERICACERDLWWYSDNNGKSWGVWLRGMTRRSFARISAYVPKEPGQPGEWWFLDRGQLWAMAPRAHHDLSQIDRSGIEWARQRRLHSLPLEQTVEYVLDGTTSSMPETNKLHRGLKIGNALPRFDIQFTWNNTHFQQDLSQTRTGFTFDSLGYNNTNVFTFFAQARWNLHGLNFTIWEVERSLRHEMYRQVSFIAQDAWQERDLLLTRIATGETTPEQTEVLKARIESLEALLEIWMRRPIVSKSAAIANQNRDRRMLWD